MTPLKGHTSPETAYVVDDYPYGFRLRCKIRYWIETKPGFGQRMASQTTNPKKAGECWNKPKPSTYSPVRVLYLDDKGHVQGDGLSPYASVVELERFRSAHADSLDDYQLRKINGWIAAHVVRTVFKVAAESEVQP